MTRNIKKKHVKIIFKMDKEDGSVEIESIWAIPITEGYLIDNIPFYIKEIAYKDIVQAIPDCDGLLRFERLIAASGHSTIRLWFSNEKDVMPVRQLLRQMGCSSELDLSRLVAVDIPPEVPYSNIRKYFDEQENAGVFEYEEACLGQAIQAHST